MQDFLEKFHNIRKGFLGNMRFLFILDMILISAIFYSIIIILNFRFLLEKFSITFPFPSDLLFLGFALLIGAMGSVLLHKKDTKINVVKLIENKYAELRERLRTAYDNRDETNVIIDSLKEQVSEALTSVSSSKLLAPSKIASKLIITILFISGAFIIGSNPQQYQIPDSTMKNLTDIVTGEENVTVTGAMEPPLELDKTNFRGGGDIFGKPKIASIQGKNIDLSLYTGSGTGTTVVDTSQPENQFIRSAVFPADILGSNVSDDYNNLLKRSEAEKQLINKYAIERSRI